MNLLIQNALLVDIDPPSVESGDLYIVDGTIQARGAGLPIKPGDQVVNCDGAVVLPGFVNGHTHLYSALAVGMPPPVRSPQNFPEILQEVWWRLDRALDPDTNEISAMIGANDAIRCGTTTLIDHHASPNAIEGSLDRIEQGLTTVGVRGILCYETTDRHGQAGREAGIQENCRYLAQASSRSPGQFAGLVGAHAAFTLDDDTLSALSELATSMGSGIHIHVAEDPCDENDALNRSAESLADRLIDHGIVTPGSILAHCTHLSVAAREKLAEYDMTVAHNARSNMNNGVGYSRPASFQNPVMLGTDGIGEDMLAEARSAWLIGQHEGLRRTPSDVVAMWVFAARRASQSLGVTLGRLREGAAADVVISNYHPFTPLNDDNVSAHLLFGLDAGHVRHVLIDGHWVLRDGEPVCVTTAEASHLATAATTGLWSRMSALE